MPASTSRKSVASLSHFGFRQADIYDVRYSGRGYDERSVVRVLTAESKALVAAVDRAAKASPHSSTITLLDFGYGTGLVTNEFAVEYPGPLAEINRDLSVVAYDVSEVGLQRAARILLDRHGFIETTRLRWRPNRESGYIAGKLIRRRGEITVAFTFVHGDEAMPVEYMQNLIASANPSGPYLTTTSWYSAIGHVAGRPNREALLSALGSLTDARGELLVAVSATGDLVVEQEESYRLVTCSPHGGLIQEAGDVLYHTELGTLNYYHVFSEDLIEAMRLVTGPDQRTWLEALRLPDEEFASKAEETNNYRRVLRFNRKIGEKVWTADDFRKVHTVLAIRSGARVAQASATASSPKFVCPSPDSAELEFRDQLPLERHTRTRRVHGQVPAPGSIERQPRSRTLSTRR